MASTNTSGIALKTQAAQVNLTPTDVKLAGLNLNATANAQKTFKSLIMKTSVSGSRQDQAAVTQEQ